MSINYRDITTFYLECDHRGCDSKYGTDRTYVKSADLVQDATIYHWWTEVHTLGGKVVYYCNKHTLTCIKCGPERDEAIKHEVGIGMYQCDSCHEELDG